MATTLAPASAASAADAADWELAYSAYLASAPNVTCRLDTAPTRSAPELDTPVAVTKAQDFGVATAACASLDESAQYPLTVDAFFQYFHPQRLRFETIPETRQTCQTSSTFGQAALQCTIQYTYPVGHYSTNTLHRPCYRIVSPALGLPAKCGTISPTLESGL